MQNPQWLRSFVVLSELGSFTRTAERLDLTQAAVSQHIRQLEAALGPLLVRRPRKIELTPAGMALLDYCREVEAADNRLSTRLADAGTDSGEISLISPGSVGLLLYPLLLDLQQKHPGLVIRHRFAPDHEVQEALLQNKYELGLTTSRPDDPRLTVSAFSEEPLELVVPAGSKIHAWEDLEKLGFIDHPDGRAMATRLLNRRFPKNPGIGRIPLSGFSNQIGLILEPVLRGLGFTVIPRYARQAFGRRAQLAVVDYGAPVVDTLWLIHRAEWPLSARAVRVLQTLRQELGLNVTAD